MIDIVERLRLGGPNAAEVTDEAADEIVRLRAALREIAVGYVDEGGNRRDLEGSGAVARKALGETDE